MKLMWEMNSLNESYHIVGTYVRKVNGVLDFFYYGFGINST